MMNNGNIMEQYDKKNENLNLHKVLERIIFMVECFFWSRIIIKKKK